MNGDLKLRSNISAADYALGVAWVVSVALHLVVLGMLGPSRYQTGGQLGGTRTFPATLINADQKRPPPSTAADWGVAPLRSPEPPVKYEEEIVQPSTAQHEQEQSEGISAEPIGDWLLPPDELSAYDRVRLTVQLLITSSGEIESVKLLTVEPDEISPSDRKSIEAWLKRTPMAPAKLGLRSVASQMTVEIVYER